ncbi:ammonia-forming cytochrome c nitrite reductase subunit c552 [Adlercreutzia sp. ZJ138]|uniref:ammonia-forming cytochrome c nitrite reductase subunit c552 n=1 Tax=Adlercreutzia sp. ZJ138 TaxID=2709405 RepID=UPI0013EB55F8|nr:ammonia-forming cytochrome c nitrite reductase subunit c552 [Adlercreutzia sp. ZJ138]
MKRKKALVGMSAVCTVALIAGLVACTPTSSSSDSSTDSDKASTATSAEVPNPDNFEYGVITADGWSEVYPNQYATYKAMGENDGEKHDYLEVYPALKTMYAGYAFSLGYAEPNGHLDSLTDVAETPRTQEKEQNGNCITCKTPQFTAQVNSGDEAVNLEKFNDIIGNYTEPISCYSCHENNPEEVVVPSAYWAKSIGADATAVPVEAQTCGQCHNEYYFSGENKVATNPYEGLEAMTPEAILAYYDEHEYKDFASNLTGAPMIKVQHPEFETMYGGKGSYMGKLGYTCADCHMGATKAEDGTEFSNHKLQSPLDNPELIENVCSDCHDDLVSQVKEITDELGDGENGRTKQVSERIELLINTTAEKYSAEIAEFQAAADAGTAGMYAAGELGELQRLQRVAQFYWDFAMNENSEGAHNSTLTRACLDMAESTADEGLAKLGVA